MTTFGSPDLLPAGVPLDAIIVALTFSFAALDFGKATTDVLVEVAWFAAADEFAAGWTEGLGVGWAAAGWAEALTAG
jgi:hypothetical protein